MAAKALSHQMNRIVRVKREKLITTLAENRRKHIKEFDEAMAGYKQLALKEIAKAFDNLLMQFQIDCGSMGSRQASQTHP